MREPSVKMAAFLLAATICLGMTPPAHAADAVANTCNAEFNDKKACKCASSRTAEFLGGDAYARYATFFEIFIERVGGSATSANDILGPWDSAQGAYAKQMGEDPFTVATPILNAEAVHRYALKACGIAPDESAKATSLFFWGEAL